MEKPATTKTVIAIEGDGIGPELIDRAEFVLLECGANVFGEVHPPRRVPAFAWGADGSTVMTKEGFIRTAERVIPRRGIEVDDQQRGFLERLYEASTAAD